MSLGGLVVGLWLLAPTAAAASWEPVVWPSPAPGVSGARHVEPDKGVLAAMWRWYRQRSDDDGAHCPYYPTCSGFGRGAVEQHGLVVGVWLTADRLLREYPGMDSFDHYPLGTPFGHPRFLDPVPTSLGEGRRRRATQAADSAASSDAPSTSNSVPSR